MDNNYLNHLLKRIAIHDDQKAFSEFFDYYHSKLIKFAHLYVPNYNQSEEIVSEVLIKLLKKRKELHKIEKFEGYLFTMVKNQSLNLLKQNKKKLNHLSIESLEDFFSTEKIDPYEKYLGMSVAVTQACAQEYGTAEYQQIDDYNPRGVGNRGVEVPSDAGKSEGHRHAGELYQ